MPNFSTPSRRQKSLKVNIPYRESGGPLHLLIDSTGIKVEGEGEWSEEGQKTVQGTVFPTNAQAWWHQAPGSPSSLGPMARYGSRRKIHIGIDEQTLEIRAAEFTTSDVGDAPFVGQTVPRTVC